MRTIGNPPSTRVGAPALYTANCIHLGRRGTQPWKWPQSVVRYQLIPVGPQRCGNCIRAYQKVITGAYICSWVQGEIVLNGWCTEWMTYAP